MAGKWKGSTVRLPIRPPMRYSITGFPISVESYIPIRHGPPAADYLYGEVPCVRNLTKEEIEDAYEKNTGVLIADDFCEKQINYQAMPAVLCKNHGPFTWGKDAAEAVHNAVVLEEVAKMAARCEMLNQQNQPAPQELQDKHYDRKHGADAYYGQQVR